MSEDGLDHRRVLDDTDDPHRPLTFRVDQGIYFVYLLNQPGPTFPERLFVSLRFKDAGDGVIQTFLPFLGNLLGPLPLLRFAVLQQADDKSPYRASECEGCEGVINRPTSVLHALT